MTASISFQVGEVSNVLRIPNAALRFYPQRDQVRPEDRPIMEASAVANGDSDEKVEVVRSAEEKAEGRRRRNRRHVWIVDGDFLRAEEVVTGLADGSYTELVGGELREGDQLVTGIQPKK